jgi:hypothetical protein
MDDLPQPPSPQMVMEMGMGGCDASDAEGVCGDFILAVLVGEPGLRCLVYGEGGC